MDELNGLALRATRVHPIASRCGVFCKTDIQNLIAKNIPKEDIAASIFHAVTVQTIVTLAHGCDITLWRTVDIYSGTQEIIRQLFAVIRGERFSAAGEK